MRHLGHFSRFPARLLAGLYLAIALAAGASLPAEDKPAAPAPAAKPVSYYRDVRPILVDHCQGCHQPAKANGKIVLSSYADLGEGGRSRKVLLDLKSPAESLLLRVLLPRDGEPPSMPKDAAPLAADRVALIRRWVEEGARDDTPAAARVEVSMEHPPVYSQPPLVTCLEYSPDGALLAVAGYHEVLLHAPDGSGIVARLVGEAERIEAVAFSPDGKQLAVVGGTPCTAGEVQLWDVEKRKLRLSVSVTHDTLYGASWSPDGALVAFGCADNTVRAIDAATGKQKLYNGAHNDWVLDTVFSKDGSHLVSVSRDRSMKLFQVSTEQFIDNITSITPGALAGGLIAVDRHPERDEVLVGGADGVPKLYKMHRTQARQIGDDFNFLRKYDALPGRIFSLELSHDGSKFVVGSSEAGTGEVRVYQTEDAKLLERWPLPTAVYAVAFAPDGKRVAAAGFDGKVRIFAVGGDGLLKELLPVPLTGIEKTL